MIAIKRSATINGKVYRFSQDAQGVSQVTEVDTSDFPPESDPKKHRGSGTDTSKRLRRLGGEIELNTTSLESLQTTSYIDVLVPYTKRAMCRVASGVSTLSCANTQANRAKIESLIQLAVYETNVAYQNSGIPGRLRLARTYLVDASYDESRYTYSTILRHLSFTDGKIDSVHTRRSSYRADMVSLIVDQGQYCGLAWVGPGTSATPFSVVHWGCATGYYSFGHELGHNFGALHDRSTSGCTATGCCSGNCYGYGWRDPNNRFRSILAYNCPSSCRRVQMFSQPEYPYVGTYGSVTIGNAYNNNARKIRENWSRISNYFN